MNFLHLFIALSLETHFPQRNGAEIISGSNKDNFPRNSYVREFIKNSSLEQYQCTQSCITCTQKIGMNWTFWKYFFFLLLSSNWCHKKMMLESLTIPLTGATEDYYIRHYISETYSHFGFRDYGNWFDRPLEFDPSCSTHTWQSSSVSKISIYWMSDVSRVYRVIVFDIKTINK